MELKDLYLAGMNFYTFMGTGIKSEMDRIPKNYSRIFISEDKIEKIKKCSKKINFLIVGETWCTDFQLNATVLKRFCELNDNLQMTIITKGRGEKYLKPILELEEFKIPVIVPLDEKYEICDEIFVERPNSIKDFNFEEIKMDYLKGKYLENTVNAFLNMIEK